MPATLLKSDYIVLDDKIDYLYCHATEHAEALDKRLEKLELKVCYYESLEARVEQHDFIIGFVLLLTALGILGVVGYLGYLAIGLYI